MASALVVLNQRGKQIITRNYRQDVPYLFTKIFAERIIDEDPSLVKPIFEVDGLTFAWIKREGLYFVLASKIDANASMLLTYLDALYTTLVQCVGVVTEDVIRDSFVILYELLDEMMDFGYPQCTDANVLQQFITHERVLRLTANDAPPPELPKALRGGAHVCPWRAEGIKYKQNEVFLDVVDSLNLLVSPRGEILQSEVVGTVKMKVKLSGMPELLLRINDRALSKPGRTSPTAVERAGDKNTVDLEDVKFHQCVRVQKYNTDRTISFIPPDGSFDLMTYRLSTKAKIRPLIKVDAQVQNLQSRMEYSIKATSQFKKASSATNVRICIPVPPDIDTPNFKANVGQVRYHPDTNTIVWTVELFQGGKEFSCRAVFGRPSVRSDVDFSRTPIRVHFEMPYFTVSNFQVKYLKVMANPQYKALTWVRYFTRSGKYEIRMGS